MCSFLVLVARAPLGAGSIRPRTPPRAPTFQDAREPVPLWSWEFQDRTHTDYDKADQGKQERGAIIRPPVPPGAPMAAGYGGPAPYTRAASRMNRGVTYASTKLAATRTARTPNIQAL